MIPAFSEILLAIIGLAALMLGVFYKKADHRMIARLVMIGFLLAGLFLCQSSTIRLVSLHHLFVMDGWACFLTILVLLSGTALVLLSSNYLEKESIARFEYPILILFSVLGMMVMISSNNFLSLYMGLELQNLALYILAAFHRDSSKSSEAGLKYFVLGALSSGLLLYGISFLYGFTGTTDFTKLSYFLQQGEVSLGVLIGLVFILIGFAFKLGVVPFHMWVPDVYEGAVTPVTAFLTSVPKLASIAVLIRLLAGPFEPLAAQWQHIILLLAAASMIVGAFAALPQKNIKRLMAYSTIGHMGYLLLGLSAASAVQEGLQEAAFQSVLLYLITYIIASIGVFTIILLMSRGGVQTEDMKDLSGLSKTNPVLALVMSVLLFSMAGFPPLAGFFGKFYVFMVAVKAGFYPLVIIGALTSVVAAYYYLRLVKLMYFEESQKEGFDKNIGKGPALLLSLTGMICMSFVFFLNPVLIYISRIVSTL